MSVKIRQLPDHLLIVPSKFYFFGEIRNNENCLDVIASFSFKTTAEIHLVRLGAIAIRFVPDGPLKSIGRLEMTSSGEIPEHVMQNQDEIVELQSRRMTFANFVAAALFGRICALRHQGLIGAQYAGMDDIIGFGMSGERLAIEKSDHMEALIEPKVRLVRRTPNRAAIIAPEHIREAIDFFDHIAIREEELERTNLQTCMVMNYQAAILHNEQHSAASVALNFAVTEALIHEIFLAYGIVGNHSPRSFATRTHRCDGISGNAFKNMILKDRIMALAKGRLLNDYLAMRIEEARAVRNNLMHTAAAVNVKDSGNLQTVVRDLWSYLLDRPFELNAGWSMRY